MKRDGANISIWQDSIENYAAEIFSKREIYDVVVVGGGISGVSTSQLLQKNGKNCLLAEAQYLGFGTTSGTTAHLNTLVELSYDEIEKKYSKESAALVLKATRDAISFIESNVTEYGLDCGFTRREGFIFSQEDEETKKLETMYEASLRAGCDVVYSDEIQIPVPFQKALRFKDQGQIHPIKYI
ncbi:MAG: FAD-dependent oxidoreductase, partial [Ferruginibacter sp.]